MKELTEIEKIYRDAREAIGISHRVASINNKLYQITYFDSCYELIKQIERGLNEFGWNSKGMKIMEGINDDKYWYWQYGQLGDLETTREYLYRGIVLESVLSKAKKIQEQLTSNPTVNELFAKAETFKRRRVFSNEGAELCIDRVLCGDPEHWSKMTKGKKNPVIKLGVNTAGNSGEGEELFNRVVSVCGVVTDLLSRAGFSVEVYSCSTVEEVTNLGGYKTTLVCLKKANEALDLQRIYSIGCVGFFRYYIFQVMCNVLNGTPYNSLGQSKSITKDMQKELGLDFIIDSKFVGGTSVEINMANLFEEVIVDKC